ncbi:hypothetical protein M9H77_21774 [Catharanthus roseus]|uniref:Uncharacterized protein n=1 Tax=Catharanthus roseus TaxID=4058 RepID=A0ACC0APA9_CATRO|nr:hypothetical protein M9H77_21774 [Catharanthus roseus]
MDPHLICLLLFLSASVFLNLEQTATAGEGIIGASFVDNNTRIGKEEMVAMEMAIEDICNQTNHCLALQVKDSQGEAALATLAVPRSWEEAASVAESTIGNEEVALPLSSLSRQKTTNESNGCNLSVMGMTSSLQEVVAQISHLIPISSFSDDSILTEELHNLKRQQCRVLFKRAKEMKMMETGYVWITTESITSLVHCFNSSTFSTMQGLLGVKSYYQNQMINYEDFRARFEDRFGLKYPQERTASTVISH